MRRLQRSALLWGAVTIAAAAGCGGDDAGDPAGPVCGNGVLEAGEACDGSSLAGQDCLTFGWYLGTLACHADCTFDVSGCVGGGPQCGNWVVEWGEECDTTDLGGGSCETVGMSPGTLACKADCTYDRSGCGAPASCGSGLIDGVAGVEECDGADLGGLSCVALGHMGGLLGCGGNCVLDESGCTDPECGNGVKEADEQCDGQDFGPEDCVMFGHTGGTLQCTAQCIVDESACTD
jgi:hypothetical protein